MSEISTRQLYELYLDALSHCSRGLLEASDEEIAYHLFEEFDVAATSFLHHSTLDRLLRAGLISEPMVHLSEELRRRWFELNTKPSAIAQIRIEEEWRQLFDLSDHICALANRPTEGS